MVVISSFNEILKTSVVLCCCCCYCFCLFCFVLFLFIITYTSTNYTKLKKIKLYIKLNTFKNQALLLFTADKLHKTQIQKVKKHFKILCQNGFSQDKSDSSNLLLSLMKRVGDVIILRFVSLVKPLLPNNKSQTISLSVIFRISELKALNSLKRGCFSLFEKNGKCLLLHGNKGTMGSMYLENYV